jgi:hypothetical protein
VDDGTARAGRQFGPHHPQQADDHPPAHLLRRGRQRRSRARVDPPELAVVAAHDHHACRARRAGAAAHLRIHGGQCGHAAG